MNRAFFGPAVAASCFTIACSGNETASADVRDTIPAEPPRPSLITSAAGSYRVVQVSSPGSISGTVDFSGAIPEDVGVVKNDPSCGTPPKSVAIPHTGTRIGGVLVWLTDIRSGKPVSPGRRFEITNDHCVIDPHLQVIPAGATVNVSSEDRMLHLNRFIDVASGKTIAVAPFNDDGEVVPLDNIFANAAQIEVVCDLHPLSHAWLAVLDHPYYATTSAAGEFSIEGIPPGKYHLRAWQPSLGVADDSVTIVAGQAVKLALKLGGMNYDAIAPTRKVRGVPGSGFAAPELSPGADSTDSSGVDSTQADSSGGR